MDTKPHKQARRDGLLSSLDETIDAVNRAGFHSDSSLIAAILISLIDLLDVIRVRSSSSLLMQTT